MTKKIDFLNELKSISNKIKVYIPSIRKNKECQPLNLKQQKNILDDISNDAASILTFFNNSYKTIEQCIDNSAELLVIDRPNILLHLRQNINNIYNGIDLSELLQKNQKIEIPSLTKTIETDDLIFEIGIPTLKDDCNTNSYLVKKYSDEKKLLGKLYVSELSKFIKNITIKSSSNTIDFCNKNVGEKFDILENIETSNFVDIYQYITEVRDVEKEFVTHDSGTIDIGPELFVL